jgi:DegV family protein with EDD domain
MSSTACILTDNSIQFSQPAFAGRELVRVIPFHLHIEDQSNPSIEELKVSDLPAKWPKSRSLHLEPPSSEIFYETLFNLTTKFDEVFVILSSSGLSSTFSNAQEASKTLQGRAAIRLFDSQSISSGLGALVQYTAFLLHSGTPCAEIEKLLRLQIPKSYSLLCPTTLSYLHISGYVDEAQSVVNDLLGINPIFTLEEGRLSPLEKSKSMHHMIEYFIEFIGEFDHLTHIGLIHPSPLQGYETREIRSFVEEMHPAAQLSEHPINLTFASMLGPKTTALFLLEKAQF